MPWELCKEEWMAGWDLVFLGPLARYRGTLGKSHFLVKNLDFGFGSILSLEFNLCTFIVAPIMFGLTSVILLVLLFLMSHVFLSQFCLWVRSPASCINCTQGYKNLGLPIICFSCLSHISCL